MLFSFLSFPLLFESLVESLILLGNVMHALVFQVALSLLQGGNNLPQLTRGYPYIHFL
jgi:hypothetical protein